MVEKETVLKKVTGLTALENPTNGISDSIYSFNSSFETLNQPEQMSLEELVVVELRRTNKSEVYRIADPSCTN